MGDLPALVGIGDHAQLLCLVAGLELLRVEQVVREQKRRRHHERGGGELGALHGATLTRRRRRIGSDMRRGPLPTLLAALLVGLGLAVVSAHAANQTVTATSSDTFEPAAVTINQGETVTWTNSGGNHNVSFDGGTFTDPPAPSSSSWTVSRRFDTPGTFHYVCVQHAPDMEGTVTVIATQTGGTPPPPPPGGGGPNPPGTPGTDTTAPVISRFGMTQCPLPREERRQRLRVPCLRARRRAHQDQPGAEAARQDALRGEGDPGAHRAEAHESEGPVQREARKPRAARGPLPRRPSRPPTSLATARSPSARRSV